MATYVDYRRSTNYALIYIITAGNGHWREKRVVVVIGVVYASNQQITP